MKVIWTEGAADDLAEIVTFIQRDSNDAALRVVRHIISKASSLSSIPKRGLHRVPQNTWELFLTPWPYVLVYEIFEDAVSIEGVRHTSRERPRRD